MTHIDDLPPADVAVTGSCFCRLGWSRVDRRSRSRLDSNGERHLIGPTQKMVPARYQSFRWVGLLYQVQLTATQWGFPDAG